MAPSTFSPADNGDVDSMVLMRTIVRLETRFIRSDAGRQIGERGLGAELATQRFARGFELTALAANAARPRVAAQRIDHRATHTALGKSLELDAARLVEPEGGVDQAQHSILDEIAQLDGVGHRGGDAAGERLHEGKTGGDPGTLTGNERLTLHVGLLGCSHHARPAELDRNANTSIKAN